MLHWYKRPDYNQHQQHRCLAQKWHKCHRCTVHLEARDGVTSDHQQHLPAAGRTLKALVVLSMPQQRHADCTGVRTGCQRWPNHHHHQLAPAALSNLCCPCMWQQFSPGTSTGRPGCKRWTNQHSHQLTAGITTNLPVVSLVHATAGTGARDGYQR